MRGTVEEQGVHAGVAPYHLDDTPCGRIPLKHHLDIVLQRVEHVCMSLPLGRKLLCETTRKTASLAKNALNYLAFEERLHGETDVLYRTHRHPFLDLDVGNLQGKGLEALLQTVTQVLLAGTTAEPELAQRLGGFDAVPASLWARETTPHLVIDHGLVQGQHRRPGMFHDQGTGATEQPLEIVPPPLQGSIQRASLRQMAKNIASDLHPRVTHMTLPLDALQVGIFNPDIDMDDVATTSRACHDEASTIDALRPAHQATCRPDLLIVANRVAIGRNSPFAMHVWLPFVSHGTL